MHDRPTDLLRRPRATTFSARKLWPRLRREGHDFARCTVDRLMPELGVAGVLRSRPQRPVDAELRERRPADRVDRQTVSTGLSPECGCTSSGWLSTRTCGPLESQIQPYKLELIHHEGSRRGVDQVEAVTVGWVQGFSAERIHRSIDDLHPSNWSSSTTQWSVDHAG